MTPHHFQLSRKQLSTVRLPYLNAHQVPTNYHTAIRNAAKGYEKARQMPHLLLVPDDQAVSAGGIFSKVRLAQTLLIVSNFLGYDDDTGLAPTVDEDTFQKLTEWNKECHNDQGWIIKDMYNEPNIGLRDDWYTDAVFAQQFFTGHNPTTITLASNDWIEAFKGAATSQGNDAFLSLLTAPGNSFYVQDFSYIRASMGAKPNQELFNDSEGVLRYGCAPVALFLLDTIVAYAKSASGDGDLVIAKAGKQLKTDLKTLTKVFAAHSAQLDDQNTPDNVLEPERTASSIVI